MKKSNYLLHASLIVAVIILALLAYHNAIPNIAFAIFLGIAAITHSILLNKSKENQSDTDKNCNNYILFSQISSTIIIVVTAILTSLNIVTQKGFTLIIFLVLVVNNISRAKANKIRKSNIKEESI